MPTAAGGYYTADGKKVPSVTTVLSKFRSSEALVAWANREGLAGRDFRTARDEAANTGTLIHAMVDAHVTGGKLHLDEDTYTEDQYDTARHAFEPFPEWWDRIGGKVVMTEQPLISEQYRYGGTPDCIGYANGIPLVLDWKTSKSVYPDHIAQVAAYRQAWNENNELQVEPQAWIVRLDKKTGVLVPKHFADITRGWELFRGFRKAYDDLAAIERLIRKAS
jgi:hypothetical protein